MLRSEVRGSLHFDLLRVAQVLFAAGYTEAFLAHELGLGDQSDVSLHLFLEHLL